MPLFAAASQRPATRAGFSLVELSIVVVVIGLILGGVLAGQHLIRASELSSITGNTNQLKKAMEQFQQKYRALPGDMPDAETYWGTDTAGCPNGNTTFKTTTCNGDGDGIMESTYHYILNGSSWAAGLRVSSNGLNQVESTRATQQLAAAGFIAGQYFGAPYSANSAIIPGYFLSTKLQGSYLMPLSLGNYAGDTEFFDGNYGDKAIILGSRSSCGAQYSLTGPSPNLTNVEASELDSKYDDGLPGSGWMVTYNTTSDGCYAVSRCTTSATAYRLDGLAAACVLIFKSDTQGQ